MSESGSVRSESLSDAERTLWGSEPLLSASVDGYRGRLMAEAWGDGFVALAMDDPSFVGPAWLAVKNWQSPQADDQLDLPVNPVLVDGARDGFVGRVIIEFYGVGSAPRMRAVGSDPDLLARLTSARLQQLQ